MAIYRLKGDAVFEAANLEEAFKRLAIHFNILSKGQKDPAEFFLEGEIQLSRRGNIVLPPGAEPRCLDK